MGYLKDPEKTKVTVDDEGWLHSGDIGKVDKKGHLHITGRIKVCKISNSRVVHTSHTNSTLVTVIEILNSFCTDNLYYITLIYLIG